VRKDPSDLRGGTRPGAGRPRKPGAISHDSRERLAATIPVHVTLRAVAGAPALASDHVMKVIREAIRDAQKAAFRVVHFNVLWNHLHLIVEASGNDALARGMQGLEVRLARRINKLRKRGGKLFVPRYHARHLKTPTQVRNALRYVLLNRKHHAQDKTFAKYWVDPCSSGVWFDGWAEPIRVHQAWMRELVEMTPPVAKPRLWLLTTGWRRHGPIAFDEHPA
jgi:REP element-mobilizing transposase RayT